MANIGSFKRGADGILRGVIHTLAFETPARLVPVEAKAGADGPDWRVFARRRVELGAAWQRVSQEGRPYLSVTLDDPSFRTPIHAALIPTEADPDRYELAWSRPRRGEEDAL